MFVMYFVPFVLRFIPKSWCLFKVATCCILNNYDPA